MKAQKSITLGCALQCGVYSEYAGKLAIQLTTTERESRINSMCFVLSLIDLMSCMKGVSDMHAELGLAQYSSF